MLDTLEPNGFNSECTNFPSIPVLFHRGRNRFAILGVTLALRALVLSVGGAQAAEVTNDQSKIEQAFLMLGQSEYTKDLVDVRNKYNITISFGELEHLENEQAEVVYSNYDLKTAKVTLGPILDTDTDIDTIADVLAHELTHAKDAQQGLYDQADKKQACLDSEFNAYHTQGLFWDERFGGSDKDSNSPIDQFLNKMSRFVLTNPATFKSRLAEVYDAQCSNIAAFFLPKPLVPVPQPTISSTPPAEKRPIQGVR